MEIPRPDTTLEIIFENVNFITSIEYQIESIQ